jgi:2-pyrone-4,6-dicarboxylate lactonase
MTLQRQDIPEGFTPNIPAPKKPTRKPGVAFPRGACDCHAHVFGVPDLRRMLSNPHFLPHPCPLPDYIAMLQSIGVERAVLVQPSVYGTDNSLLSDALRSKTFELRGVAVVRPDISMQELEAMHAIGFRGIRINTASATPGLRLEDAALLAKRIEPLGWHLQFFVNFEALPEAEQVLANLPVNVVIDHFGLVKPQWGPESEPWRALMRLMRKTHCWVKLMGPYFISDDFPEHRDVDALARALVETAPDRVLWGTDWPHPSARAKMPHDADLADILARWIPDAATRARVLVDNPARLYGFGAG